MLTRATTPPIFLMPHWEGGLSPEALCALLLEVAEIVRRPPAGQPARELRHFEEPVFLAAAQLVPGASMWEGFVSTLVSGRLYAGSATPSEGPMGFFTRVLRYRGRQFNLTGFITDEELTALAHATMQQTAHRCDPNASCAVTKIDPLELINPRIRKNADHPARTILASLLSAGELADRVVPAARMKPLARL